ncbi:hypothetical protein [Cupriavidus agavae]
MADGTDPSDAATLGQLQAVSEALQRLQSRLAALEARS